MSYGEEWKNLSLRMFLKYKLVEMFTKHYQNLNMHMTCGIAISLLWQLNQNAIR